MPLLSSGLPWLTMMKLQGCGFCGDILDDEPSSIQLQMQLRGGGAVLSQAISLSQRVISPLFVIILLGMPLLYFCFVTCYILGHCLSLLCVAVINIITKRQLGKKRICVILQHIVYH